MTDVVVAGGGLGGLMTACLLAQRGRRVVVVERGAHPGGRARTQAQDGFLLNLGPHALYRHGEAAAVLRSVGVSWRGGTLPNEAWGVAGDRLAPLPAGPWTLWSTSWLKGSERLSLLRWFLRLRTIAAEEGGTWGERVADAPPGVRRLLDTLARTSTYAWPVDPLDGPTVARQVLLGLRGVVYLDGGWQSLVDGLVARARALGVQVVCGEEVVEVDRGVRTTEAHHRADHVVLALPAPSLRRLGVDTEGLVPARMSCLDLGGPITPRVGVALGVGEPLYLSDHTRAAALAPAGQRLVHLGRYLTPGEDGAAARASLEALADRLVPGWRAEASLRRFTPALTVAAGLPVGRRVPAQLDSGAWVVGDCVEGPGLLLDAVAAGASRAARGILGARRALEACPA